MPVTMPMRAHMNCTQAMNGQVMNAVHSIAVPICAPAMELVAMPDGSSSAAPVINPGPSTEKKRLMRLNLFEAVFFAMLQTFSTCLRGASIEIK